MLTSKELLEQTGISRATLNNYIALGIVPKPDVLPPQPDDGAAPRIGYFPADTAQRIADIQRLKNQGWTMSRIAAHFGGRASAEAPQEPMPPPRVAVASPPPAARPQPPAPPRLSIEEIAHPACLVDRNFDIVWFNAASAPLLGAAAGQNLFRYLLQARDPRDEALLRFHVRLARQLGASVETICRDAEAPDRALLERLYHETGEAAPLAPVSHAFVPAATGGASQLCLYAVRFREGLLLVQVPRSRAGEELASQLEAHEVTLGGLGRKRLPVLSDVAAVVMDLQHAGRIWSALPAEEYFELINQIWVTAEPIFRRHQGTQGKHPRDGIACYFLPQRDGSHVWNAVQAAHDMREAMRGVSQQWQLRKGWGTELYMNTGIDEGQQWLGTLRSAGQVEFTMFGDILNRAARLSDFARGGAVWATKNLIVKLEPQDRQRLRWGVHRRDQEGRELFVPCVFATVEQLAEGPLGEKLHDIARLPVTEIADIAVAGRRAGDQHPH
ncbi:adenylate/guanylate cyclase domain-containing protein [Ramlibacter sp.]|uniref:adenylate/guanylate cyclase domain-containing protein n=1 Tax=Ramlibacter sp. TaxID=1917967 RepID=UPI002C222266|nr:adenylate/guanylate cyclase domain-containing protein [Ramlibacter sp.]HWI83169.1 adenylate/guanylate cyclase domain-containing protein [Ramlibacter sp.]